MPSNANYRHLQALLRMASLLRIRFAIVCLHLTAIQTARFRDVSAALQRPAVCAIHPFDRTFEFFFLRNLNFSSSI